ncbi:MAG: prepilin-type N-terminal cleavage/methylation domain-containing protein [Coriobacteriaceae bacterium]|jgi:prepilin-type N-terminal cleavage/methylation domain-containing protein|nr:prepilin-type N-terminal cleavage/methylation domain-containing protein [Coriobacteriaceae bacterium]
MIEMLKNRKEALQKRGVKGFTLMEMLIVIAIIAVLVAIAIPVLGAQLDRSKDATDEANARSIYGLVQADVMSPYTGTGATATKVEGPSGTDPKVYTVTLSDGSTQKFEFSTRTQELKTTIDKDKKVVTVDLTYGGGTAHFGTTDTPTNNNSGGNGNG